MEDWNKDECLRPLFLVFSGFTFSFPIWQICRRCLVWDLNFHLTVQLYSLQTLAAECCTETHGWSSCNKLFSNFSVNFRQIFSTIICPITLICDLPILFSLTESLVGSEIELFGRWQNPNTTITIEFSRAKIRSPPRPGARPHNWVPDSHHLSLLQNSFFLISSGFAFLIC